MKNTKKRYLKLLSAILCLVLLLSVLTGCRTQKTVMSYEGSKITDGEFTFYLATYKSQFMRTYSDFKDSDQFYNMVIDENGTTAEESLFSNVVDNVKMMLVCDALCKRFGLTVPRTTTDNIDEYLNGLASQYADGNLNSFNETLGKYGINKTMLRDIYMRYEKINLVFDHLYGTGGTNAITNEDLITYFNNNYVRVQHIYVNNKFKYLTDEEGYILYNNDGSYKQTDLTEDEKKEKNELIEKIDSLLEGGADYMEVYTEYSEDHYYDNGYYLYPSMDFVEELITSAFSLEIGETCKVESEIGTHYLLRLESEEAPWTNPENEDFFYNYETTVSEWRFNEFLADLIAKVEINEDVLDSFSLRDSLTNSLF